MSDPATSRRGRGKRKMGWGTRGGRGKIREFEKGRSRRNQAGPPSALPDFKRPDPRPASQALGRQPSGGRQDCMRGAAGHPLLFRATDVLGLTQALGQR
ncbi:hypothetical protein HPB47_004636 [Ixodes persulcatus]|uniref:Uncharacterized protein n=1 Tax=Ixodes persulcatus TaxID=34615 RepID=A0AC60PFP4_IXOPE|nr:hypothetical protein HPB47_004636 [Ixodes persulcatus]